MKLKVAGVALSSALVALTLIGCGGSKEGAPQCGSSDTLNALKKFIDEKGTSNDMKLENFIAQDGTSKDAKKAVCKADVVGGKLGPRNNIKKEDGISVKYTVQYTEDGKTVISGVSFPGLNY